MPPSYNSPKRKRGPPPHSNFEIQVQDQIPPAPPSSSPSPPDTEMRLNTAIPGTAVVACNEGSSPRTKVAYNFQGLQLEDGGDVSELSLDLQPADMPKLQLRFEIGPDEDENENAVRKRMRVLDRSSGNRMELGGRGMEIPETPMGNGKKATISTGPERTIGPMIQEKARGVVLHNEVDPVIFKGSPIAKAKGSGLGRAYPSINRLSDSKSRAKKRMGSPPLFGAVEASLDKDVKGEMEVVDEERAALTWHDDEITGHDPDDPDDDGEGINGIGFRPTPAEAYARAQKRRQQMQEYRNREAKEARAKRSENRRRTGGSDISVAASREKEAERRVRFLEAEKSSVVATF